MPHKHGGFEASPERTVGTYSKYNSIDDKIDDFSLPYDFHQGLVSGVQLMTPRKKLGQEKLIERKVLPLFINLMVNFLNVFRKKFSNT